MPSPRHRSPRLFALLALVVVSCADRSGSDAVSPPDVAPAVASDVVATTAPPAPAPAAPAVPDDNETPPPPPPSDEPVVLAPAPVASERGTLALVATFHRRDRVRRHVTWARGSHVSVVADGQTASARVDSNVETVYAMTVTDVDKGSLATAEVRFETFARHASGSPTTLAGDPRAGDVWTCRTDRSPALCATGRDTTRPAPPWLVLSVDPLLPARAVQPGETWSRRVGVAPLLGLGETGVARAVLTAEAPYETVDGLFSTLTIAFEGDDRVNALGRQMRGRVAGTGAMEFDLRHHRVVAYDVQWSSEAAAERLAGASTLGFDRETSLVLRMTELPAQ